MGSVLTVLIAHIARPVRTPVIPELLKLAFTRGQFSERRPVGACEATDEGRLIPKTMVADERAASRDAGVFAERSLGNRRDEFAS